MLIAAEEFARRARIQSVPVRGAIWRRGGRRREVRRSLVFTAKEAATAVGTMAKEEEETKAEEETAAAMASVTGHCI